jgi:hypothetical protein
MEFPFNVNGCLPDRITKVDQSHVLPPSRFARGTGSTGSGGITAVATTADARFCLFFFILVWFVLFCNGQNGPRRVEGLKAIINALGKASGLVCSLLLCTMCAVHAVK